MVHGTNFLTNVIGLENQNRYIANWVDGMKKQKKEKRKGMM